MKDVKRTTVIGRPAHHARGLARAAAQRMLLAGAAAVLLALALVLLYRSGSRLLPVLSVLGVPFLIVAAAQFSTSRVKFLQARVGVVAEQRVARVLARIGGDVLLNGVLLGAGDIDHVLLGPWALAVETKHARGRFSIDRQGRLQVGRRVLPRDPVGQASRNAAMLARHLGLPVTGLLVLSEGEGRPFRLGDVVVLGAASLPQLTGELPRVLNSSSAARMTERLTVADPGPARTTVTSPTTR